MTKKDYSTYTDEELLKEIDLMDMAFEADREMGGYNFDGYLEESYGPWREALYAEIDSRDLLPDTMTEEEGMAEYSSRVIPF